MSAANTQAVSRMTGIYPRHQANIQAMKQAQQITVEKMQERGSSQKEVMDAKLN